MAAFQRKSKISTRTNGRKKQKADSKDNEEQQKSRHPGVGSDFSQGTFERHAEHLSDARMAHPANAAERSSFVQQIQRDYGNTYVQRLVDHVSQQKAETIQRVAMPGSEPFLRIVQSAGELVYHFNSLKIHPKTMCNDSLSIIGSLATMVKDKNEIEFSARLSQAMINYLHNTDHDKAMGTLQGLSGIVQEALSDLASSGNSKAKDIAGWLPKSVNKIPISPAVATSLTWPKPAQEVVAPQQQDSSSTDDDPIYSNDNGVAIPVQDQEEDLYNNVSPEEEEDLYNNVTPEEEEDLYNNLEAEEEEDLYNNV